MLMERIQESVQDPPQVIRIGDRVIVTKPEFVTRVGYPLSFSDAIKWVTENKRAELLALFNFNLNRCRYSQEFYDRALRAAARAYLQCRGYGGIERRIHTSRVEKELGKVCTVCARKVVTTGDYFPPSGSGEDWESGGLGKPRTHVILCLGMDMLNFPGYDGTLDDIWAGGAWIERCNVRSVE